ncbi:MAG: hypothetical protein E7624_01780 [Ruminococcaceae bacterium]|nr:hypothetical protein [Oscillospiraceae bacterium]
MKKTRILSFFLAILMLCSCGVLLASCGGDGGIEISNEQQSVDLSKFSIYYSDDLQENNVFRDMATLLAQAVSARTGKAITARTFDKAPAEADQPEILIGNTSRAESVNALASVDGDGFAIYTSENKIAITGSSKMFTMYALCYFFNNYFSGEGNGATVTLPVEIHADEVPLVPLANKDGYAVSFVYGADLNDSTKYTGAPGVSGTGHDHRDYPFAAVENIVNKLSDMAKLGKRGVTKYKDSTAAAGAEFMVGIVEREPVKQALSKLKGSEYCFCVQNGQIYMTAWNDAALAACYTFVEGFLEIAAITAEDGSVTVALPEGFTLFGNGNPAWVTDFPKPDGLQLYNTLDTAENSLQYLYLGEGVSAEAFRAYGEKLKGEGYTVLAENEIEESLFATFVNKEAGLMIYVAYNAYAHQSEYAHKYERALRVVVCPTSTHAVPDAAILNANQNYKKVTDTAVTQIALEKGYVGMSYVITLEDGRFIIFDGGKTGSGSLAADHLWDVLNASYKRIYGKEPTKNDPVRVAAWVITHSHGDHYNVAKSLLKNYGASGLLDLEYLIGNYPSKSAVWPIYNADIGMMTEEGTIESLQRVTDFTYLKVHAGQKYYFANLEIEVITTYDDLNPTRVHVQNDTNTVLRFTLKKQGKEDYTMLWLGDANARQSRFMCAMYGNYLKSDMVQVAHHGNTGCETDLYSTVNAPVVFFPNRLESYQMYLDPANRKKSVPYEVDQALIYDNPNTKYVFVAHEYHTTIRFDADNKPMLDQIYDGVAGPETVIEYVTNVQIGGAAIKVRD